MTDILVILLILITLYQAKIIKPVSDFYDTEYISLETGKCIRGLCALVVVFHHMAQKTDTGMVFHVFASIGVYPVSMFFFYSGYGLTKSYLRKPDYTDNYLIKRISPVLIPYLFCNILYYVLLTSEGEDCSFWHIMQDFFHGELLMEHSWYVICILIFYTFFYAEMKLCKRNPRYMIIAGCIFEVGYVSGCLALFPEKVYWYNTAHILILGSIWALYEKQILTFLKSKFWLKLLFFGCLTLAPKVIFRDMFKSADTMLSVIFFVFLVNQILLKIRIQNVILSYLGKISYEIYLLHGFFMILLRGSHIYIENDLLWSAGVLIGALLLSSVCHLLFQYLTKQLFALTLKSGESKRQIS